MGKEKYLKDIETLFKKSPVVSYNSITKIIRNKKPQNQYSKQLIRNLILKGKVRKLTKGYYTSHNDPSLSVFCFKPAYLGLQDALSFHNLWEQETIPIIVTSARVRPGIRRVLGYNVLLRRIDKRYFFGFDYYKENELYMPYSDIEKTLIDIIHFKEKLSVELIKEIEKKINKRRFKSYLNRYPKIFRRRVLNMIRA